MDAPPVGALGGPPDISVPCIPPYAAFSSPCSTFWLLMYGFRPLLKLCVHMQALMIVVRMRMMVRTAKVVNSFLAGL